MHKKRWNCNELQVPLMKSCISWVLMVAVTFISSAFAGEPLKGDVTNTEPKKVEYPRQTWPDSTSQGGSPAPVPASSTVPIPDPCASKPELCK